MPRKPRLTATELANARTADVEIAVAGLRRRKQQAAPTPSASEHATSERIPRISRLMALAIKRDDMIARGEVKDYADIARLGYVTRARVTQIMNFLNLAPDLQEAILFLPKTAMGRDPVSEHVARHLTAIAQWDRQRNAWRGLPGRIADQTVTSHP
jgi:hypothetical protein